MPEILPLVDRVGTDDPCGGVDGWRWWSPKKLSDDPCVSKFLKKHYALIPCKKQDKRIGGMNSLYFSLIHCEYIYTKANLTFLIDYNSIRQVF